MHIARGLMEKMSCDRHICRPIFIPYCTALLLLMPGPLFRQVAGETNFKSIAKQIDLQLQASLEETDPIDDATFLSRVSLDLVGRRPNADQIRNFVHNADPRKRTTAIQQLLEDPQFGKHWGRYWRDTILARRADERALQ